MGMLPIRLNTLKGGIKLGFDLYLKLPHKTIHYINAQDDIEDIRLQSLKEKKVRKLYIKEDQEEAYQSFIDRCLESVMSDSSVNIEEKASLVVSAGENAAERIFQDPQSKKSYMTAQNTTMNLINALGKSSELLKGIFDKKIEASDDSIAYRMHKHAVNTSSLCIAYSEFLGLKKERIELLGMAGLFHDIAFTTYSHEEQSLFAKPISQMQAPELTRYKEHPKLGAELLQDKDFASKDLIMLVLSHEERTGGAGFPNKLAKLDNEQSIIALASYYDYKITCLGIEREEVLKNLSIDEIGLFELELVSSFKKFIKKSGMK